MNPGILLVHVLAAVLVVDSVTLPGDLVYCIDRKLDALPPEAISAKRILSTVQELTNEFDAPHIVMGVVYDRFADRSVILSILRQHHPLQFRAAIPKEGDIWPADTAAVYELLLGGFRFDMGQYMAKIHPDLDVKGFAALLPYFKNRNAVAAVAIFKRIGRGDQVAALLSIPVIRDEIWNSRPDVYEAAFAMARGDDAAFQALVWHESAPSWINKLLWTSDDTLLHIAARRNALWAIPLLCAAPGIDVHAVNAHYETALDVVEPDSPVYEAILQGISLQVRSADPNISHIAAGVPSHPVHAVHEQPESHHSPPSSVHTAIDRRRMVCELSPQSVLEPVESRSEIGVDTATEFSFADTSHVTEAGWPGLPIMSTTPSSEIVELEPEASVGWNPVAQAGSHDTESLWMQAANSSYSEPFSSTAQPPSKLGRVRSVVRFLQRFVGKRRSDVASLPSTIRIPSRQNQEIRAASHSTPKSAWIPCKRAGSAEAGKRSRWSVITPSSKQESGASFRMSRSPDVFILPPTVHEINVAQSAQPRTDAANLVQAAAIELEDAAPVTHRPRLQDLLQATRLLHRRSFESIRRLFSAKQRPTDGNDPRMQIKASLSPHDLRRMLRGGDAA